MKTYYVIYSLDEGKYLNHSLQGKFLVEKINRASEYVTYNKAVEMLDEMASELTKLKLKKWNVKKVIEI
jgi:hypothetical protein